jgi:hypothetical protein
LGVQARRSHAERDDGQCQNSQHPGNIAHKKILVHTFSVILSLIFLVRLEHPATIGCGPNPKSLPALKAMSEPEVAIRRSFGSGV